MSEILSGLNSQLAATNSQIAKKGREINALKVLIQEWFVEQKRIEGLLASAGITTSAGKKQQYVDGINNAKSKIAQYNLGIDQRNIDIANLQSQKAAIQKNIDDYQEAVESSIAQGIPEEGSIALADDFVRREMESREKAMKQQEEEQQGKKLNRQIFVGVGVVAALVVIWFVFKKIKKGKK